MLATLLLLLVHRYFLVLFFSSILGGALPQKDEEKGTQIFKQRRRDNKACTTLAWQTHQYSKF